MIEQINKFNDFVERNKWAFILSLSLLIIGSFIGNWATETGIREGYYEKSGYYYYNSQEDYNLETVACNHGCSKMLEIEYGTYSVQFPEEYNAHFFICKEICEKEFNMR